MNASLQNGLSPAVRFSVSDELQMYYVILTEWRHLFSARKSMSLCTLRAIRQECTSVRSNMVKLLEAAPMFLMSTFCMSALGNGPFLVMRALSAYNRTAQHYFGENRGNSIHYRSSIRKFWDTSYIQTQRVKEQCCQFFLATVRRSIFTSSIELRMCCSQYITCTAHVVCSRSLS